MGDVKGLLDPEFLGKLAVSTAGFAAGGPLGAAAAAGGYEAATGGDLESSLTQAGIAGLGGAATNVVAGAEGAKILTPGFKGVFASGNPFATELAGATSTGITEGTQGLTKADSILSLSDPTFGTPAPGASMQGNSAALFPPSPEFEAELFGQTVQAEPVVRLPETPGIDGGGFLASLGNINKQDVMTGAQLALQGVGFANQPRPQRQRRQGQLPQRAPRRPAAPRPPAQRRQRRPIFGG